FFTFSKLFERGAGRRAFSSSAITDRTIEGSRAGGRLGFGPGVGTIPACERTRFRAWPCIESATRPELSRGGPELSRGGPGRRDSARGGAGSTRDSARRAGGRGALDGRIGAAGSRRVRRTGRRVSGAEGSLCF